MRLIPALGLDAIYPPACPLCDAPLEAGQNLCAACAAQLPWISHACRQCGRALESDSGALCGRCLRRPPAYDGVFAPLAYKEPVDRLIAEFKFRGRLSHALMLSKLMIEAADAHQRTPPELFLPVPLHPRRLRERGYNQAHELARLLGRHYSIKADPYSLKRERNTEAQMRLPARQRLRNVRGAFRLRRSRQLPESVAIVDDVMTTGATVNEIAMLLRRAGVTRIEVWALARAGTANPP